MNINLIGTYAHYIRQQQPGGAIIKKYARLNCMKIIYPATIWFKIVELKFFGLAEVAKENTEYIDESSARLIQLFNQAWLQSYLCPREVVFDNVSQLKQYFNLFIKDINIIHV